MCIAPNRIHTYLDIENLCAAGRLTSRAVLEAKAALGAINSPGKSDLLTVGCDFGNVFVVRQAFPGARVVTGTGPDGADLALLEAIEDDLRLKLRSPFLTLVSGDHFFASPVSVMATMGLITRVIGRLGHVSAKLRLAAHSTTYVPETTSSYERSA